MSLSVRDKLHMLHRCWRLRFKSEVSSIQYVRHAIPAGATVLDIGANKGVFSVYMSRAIGADGQLIAFEAQPELGEHLNNVKNSFSLDNMTLVNLGLSSEPGTLTMRRSEAGSGMASFHNDTDEALESIDITVIRLDDYVRDKAIGRISFIKCDVEGHELAVFEGGEETLRRDRPTLLFECHDSAAEDGRLFDYLVGLGYDGFFYHVTAHDHQSLLYKGRGKYVRYSEYANYDHVREGVHHRNYIFVASGNLP